MSVSTHTHTHTDFSLSDRSVCQNQTAWTDIHAFQLVDWNEEAKLQSGLRKIESSIHHPFSQPMVQCGNSV